MKNNGESLLFASLLMRFIKKKESDMFKKHYPVWISGMKNYLHLDECDEDISLTVNNVNMFFSVFFIFLPTNVELKTKKTHKYRVKV